MSDNTQRLLMASADTGAPRLSAVPAETAADRPCARLEATHLYDKGGDPNDLSKQRWGVVAPAGEIGDRLLAAVAPLLKHRAAQQGAEPEVARVPSGLNPQAAHAWKAKRFIGDGRSALDDTLPRYRLVLGDLHEVPPAVHQVLATDGFVGRLAFDSEAGYEAYVSKLMRWETSPAARREAETRLYTVRDGTAATQAGAEHLMGPLKAGLHEKWSLGSVPLAGLVDNGDQAPDRDAFVRMARQTEAGVLFSLSHGLGAPEGGWGAAEQMYRLQGALAFGDGDRLEGSDLASGAFAPGSLWFMFACFGAGTPATSAYHQWLKVLAEAGQSSPAEVAMVLDSLPGRVDGRPFVAHLPKAALANPDGPLGVIGHLDLAWSYSFQRLDGRVRARPGKFGEVVKHAARTDRLGIAFDALYSGLVDVDHQLNEVQRVRERGEAPRLSTADRGHLWMLRQDLMGYVLLGDPAARLPLASTAPAAPPEPRRTVDPAVVEGLEDAEYWVLQALSGSSDIHDVADLAELDPERLRRRAEAYQAAGRRALAELLQEE